MKAMKTLEEQLYSFIEPQLGYFTTKQALQAGYPSSSHHYHVARGSWIREYRGIFRLVRYPLAEDGQYVLWSLWSRNRQDIPQGIYSHQTALSLHGLSDVMPARIHITVPVHFRRGVPAPKILHLHRSHVPNADIQSRQGYRVVRPLRAITELLQDESESRDHLRDALKQGLARGVITRSEIAVHSCRKEIKALLETS